MKMNTQNGDSKRYPLWSVLLFACTLLFCIPGLTTAEEEQLFFDDFSAGLDLWTVSGPLPWNIESLHASSGYPPLASGAPAAHMDRCGENCAITTTAIDLSSAVAARIDFLRFVDSNLDAGERLELQFYNGSTWIPNEQWGHDNGEDDNQWHPESIDITAYIGVTDFKVRFITNGSYIYEHVQVDDVKIIVETDNGPPCGDGVCDPQETHETCPEDCPDEPSNTIFFDSFEDLNLWRNVFQDTFNIENLNADTDYPIDASGATTLNADSCGNGCRLALQNTIDLSRKHTATLSFLRFVDSSLEANESLAIHLWNGSEWNRDVFYWTDGNGDDGRWHAEVLDLSDYVGSSSFSILIESFGNSNAKHLQIDDLRITAEALPPIDYATISGTITTENGTALSGVTVTLAGTSYSAVTDSNGAYQITDIPDGEYIVTPSLQNHIFNPDTVSISVQPDTIVMNFPTTGPETANFANFDRSAVDFVGGTYVCATPIFNYYYWSLDLETMNNNNCYSYAINVLNDTDITTYPGAASGYNIEAASEYYSYTDMDGDVCRVFREGAIRDGLEYIGNDTTCPDNKTLVALFAAEQGGAFHWYRRDYGSYWSEKNGTNAPQRLRDANGNLVTNIEDVNNFWYPRYCGNFCVCSSATPGQGHENIASPVF